jgi:hypothetical protein
LRDLPWLCDISSIWKILDKAGIPWEAISAKLKNEADNAQLNQIQQ